MDEILGTILAFGFNFTPSGWIPCQGQILPVPPYQALASLLGNTYGGDGTTTFGLPDLRGRSLIGAGQLSGTSYYVVGQFGGSETLALTAANMPAHSHSLATTAGATTSLSVAIITSSTTDNTTESGAGTNSLGTGDNMLDVYRESNNKAGAVGGVVATLSGNTSSVGTGTAFNNRDPYLVTNYCICVSGIYPTRD